MSNTVELELAGRKLVLETGKVAKQASGAVTVRYGDTVVLVTAVASEEPLEASLDFVPLLVDYREKSYAAGRIPGGFFKREGRPTEKEIMSSRQIDRPIRPMFSKDFKNELQIVATVLSSDQENDSDVLAMVGASAALCLSDIPFPEPVSAVRIGRIDGKFVVNPTFSELDRSDMDVVVAGTDRSVLMVEGGSKEVHEKDLIAALALAHEHIGQVNGIQTRLREMCGKTKMVVPVREMDPGLLQEMRANYLEVIREANRVSDKEKRQDSIKRTKKEASLALGQKFPGRELEIGEIVNYIEKEDLRRMILTEKRRVDGRSPGEIRPISCEVGVLPRTHGSALFTRGQTQSLVVTTLGTSLDEQRVEELEGESWKTYMLHYNFPPFSVGEVRPMRGPGRREIGHGALAERAIHPMIPASGEFPYTIRIVSDILESNGSSSMATVCGASLSLMDAGVPIKAAVAGIAMGLVKENDSFEILTDILGIEDHLGDMDFKVTGTRKGVTAFQMDVKATHIGFDTLTAAMERARDARIHVLDAMDKCISAPRSELSPYAPRITVIQIDQDKIRDVIGPGGRVIKKITEETGAKVNIEDSGEIKIASYNAANGEKALMMIKSLTEDPEIGRIYHGKVKRVVPFGAFVEILPGRDGLVHISELENRRVACVEDVVREGDMVMVKVIGIDREGKIKLSRKAALGAASTPDA
ncbi:MAG: polyribonucleotide nucleotidyltransferase [Candidatus Eisenbacteria bacterium]|nr:polyribonucleotide nucleotidyltransferase [Candidatus Eisenbacteria bacterium]